MNNFNPKNPYFKGAIFTCNCSNYATNIYSNLEWLNTTEEKICGQCKKAYNKHFDAGNIWRHDLGEAVQDIPLHMQFVRLPGEFPVLRAWYPLYSGRENWSVVRQNTVLPQ